MIPLRPVTAVLISVVLSFLPAFQSPAATNVTSTTSSFTLNNIASGDVFGLPMSMSGDTAVIGDSDDSHDGPSSGAAYVFVKDGAGWVQQQKLLPTTPADNQSFGISVGIEAIRLSWAVPEKEIYLTLSREQPTFLSGMALAGCFIRNCYFRSGEPVTRLALRLESAVIRSS